MGWSMALYVNFWGTRGSIPTPGHRTQRYGGNTCCVEIRALDTLIVCDAGSGIRELGMDLMRRFGGKPITLHLLLSHTHWDHIQGFPFFIPAYLPSTTIYVYGASKDDRSSHQLLTGQMESAHFPVRFSESNAKILARDFDAGAADIDGVTVQSFSQHHPGGSLGFRFEHEGAKVVYATDNELDQGLLNAKSIVDDPTTIREFDAQTLAAVRDADLLIMDAQYPDEEYRKKVGWGHPRLSTVIDLAVQGNVKQLALFHHDPMQSDADVDQKVAMAIERSQAYPAAQRPLIFGAREGMELKIVPGVD